MDKDQKERYVRWQNYRITQLSFSINLFLGFAVASLAYAINLKLSSEADPAVPLGCVIILWSVSAAFGCAATVSRLLDYRYTAKKIKEGGGLNAFMAKWCGPITWGFFWVQIFTYAVGAYLFIQGVVNA
ncbi:hypothetical protein [Salinivibrio sp. VYel4]|uniref:hypothetical protein n=1 Tax=Salinivibrio sp. VYel4 TaxID=2490491 RepID=UPI00128D5F21|nr:hypothetical protein [Salinivibrio sp. VYel4]MPY01358.1 hypothetical protein [Salinivibrio sp. VYel4]